MSPKRKETETKSGSTSDHPTKKVRVQIDSEELLEQSQSRQNEDEESKNSFSPMRRELISNAHIDLVKTISIDRFRFAMPMDHPKEVTGDLVLKYQLGKRSDEFRTA
ncbi:hypothetical protein P3S68_011215 [Capsicum galapagoense]